MSNQSNQNGPEKLQADKRTSNSLIAGVQNNDTEAWNRLAKLYSPLVLFWCRESGLPRPDVDDIFQDVFQALAFNIKKYRPMKTGSFRGWLRTLTRNKVNDHFRKVSRVARPAGGTEAIQMLNQLPEPEPKSACSFIDEDQFSSVPDSCSTHPGRELELEQAMLRRALENIRDQFAEKTWQAFLMVAVQGRSVRDVAAELGMQPGNVRVAKFRALKRLRQEIGDSVK